MSEIRRVEIYKWKGKEYRSLTTIRTEVENELGKIIDTTLLSTKDRLAVFNALAKNREKVVELLTVWFDYEPENNEVRMTNILDI